MGRRPNCRYKLTNGHQCGSPATGEAHLPPGPHVPLCQVHADVATEDWGVTVELYPEADA